MDAAEFSTRLAGCALRTEAMLDRVLGAAALSGEIARPKRLVDAMRYATLGGGKRLRPFLLMESARMFGAEGAGIVRAGAALELVHCYSLAHDDLPAMDDDDIRRGRASPTTCRNSWITTSAVVTRTVIAASTARREASRRG